MHNRHQITMAELWQGLDDLIRQLILRLNQKGLDIMVSSHEALGIITEEIDELVGAVRSNCKGKIEDELLDVAVGAIFGYVSSKTGEQDWPQDTKKAAVKKKKAKQR